MKLIRHVDLCEVAEGNAVLESYLEAVGEEIGTTVSYAISFDYFPGCPGSLYSPPEHEDVEYLGGLDDGKLYLTALYAANMSLFAFADLVAAFHIHEMKYINSQQFFDDARETAREDRADLELLSIEYARDDLNFSLC